MPYWITEHKILAWWVLDPLQFNNVDVQCTNEYCILYFEISRDSMVGFYIYNVFHFILVDYSVYWPCDGSKK